MPKGTWSFLSYTLPYIEKILSTSTSRSWDYGPLIEMGIVPEVSSCPELGRFRPSS